MSFSAFSIRQSGNPFPLNRIVRTLPCSLVLVLALALAGCSSNDQDGSDPYPNRRTEPPRGAAYRSSSSSQLERALFSRVNAYRKSLGLGPLEWSDEMARLARSHTQSMISRKQLSHDGFHGRTDSLRRSGYTTASENVAYFKGHSDPVESALEGWKKSPGHFRNMTKATDWYSGVGAAVSRDGYTYFTQLYGR